MKLRSLALALSFSVATTGVVAPTVQAQESRTMAEQYEPEFAPIPKPFIGTTTSQTAGSFRYSGVPAGTELTVLNPNFGSDGDEENGLLVSIIRQSYGPAIWLHVFPEDMQGESASNPVKFFVAYPDGSTEIVEHTFTVYPLQKFVYSPWIGNALVEEGGDSLLTIEDLPQDAQVQIVDVPAGWKVDVEGNILRVNAPEAGDGDVVAYITFADESNLVTTFKVSAQPALPEPAPKPEPTDNSGSSSGTTIIALILGLLGLGGAAAFFFNNMTR